MATTEAAVDAAAAERFAARVEACDALDLACPASLSLVCFRLAGAADDEARQTELLEAVRAAGIFIIHSKLGGRKILRFACGGIEQLEEEVDDAAAVIEQCARQLLGGR